jgi:hypothetical protein
MTETERKDFLREFDLAAAEIAKLREMFPGAFHADGTPRVASVPFDRASETDDNEREPQ